ncbi:hypothetical protein TRFO_21488 [Tritrichomonas foetus]|uniref:Kinase n=1 Tax=Tritrichomonas foetus TaxID=1144522 RepID=A0A1J4KIU0_9EUKA|nr:hypothetical protein TRFO_21488 [Tritrichomonas foetus]|eukprot:OHT09598.1 hypothetical protein TRFO_21488 [Tritrichomonas foetus]
MIDFVEFLPKKQKDRHNNVTQCVVYPGNVPCIAKINKHNESSIYHFISSLSLKEIVPKHFGTWKLGDEEYLILEDLLSGFSQPNMVDIKLGTRTFDIRTKRRAITKLSNLVNTTTSHDFGFRVTEAVFFKRCQLSPKSKLTNKIKNTLKGNTNNKHIISLKPDNQTNNNNDNQTNDNVNQTNNQTENNNDPHTKNDEMSQTESTSHDTNHAVIHDNDNDNKNHSTNNSHNKSDESCDDEEPFIKYTNVPVSPNIEKSISEVNNLFRSFFTDKHLQTFYKELNKVRDIIIMTKHQFPGFRVYASSLFVAYNASVNNSELRVKIIDLAHVHFDVKKDGGEQDVIQYDDGVVRGLDSLISLVGLALSEKGLLK